MKALFIYVITKLCINVHSIQCVSLSDIDDIVSVILYLLLLCLQYPSCHIIRRHIYAEWCFKCLQGVPYSYVWTKVPSLKYKQRLYSIKTLTYHVQRTLSYYQKGQPLTLYLVNREFETYRVDIDNCQEGEQEEDTESHRLVKASL